MCWLWTNIGGKHERFFGISKFFKWCWCFIFLVTNARILLNSWFSEPSIMRTRSKARWSFMLQTLEQAFFAKIKKVVFESFKSWKCLLKIAYFYSRPQLLCSSCKPSPTLPPFSFPTRFGVFPMAWKNLIIIIRFGVLKICQNEVGAVVLTRIQTSCLQPKSQCQSSNLLMSPFHTYSYP